ncbi:hypothetical protein WCV21_10950, partial [Lactobacillus helveticus]|uniref:hypothetical protein n=1 Tax=Lactobacillus helveticus TaxID=1587 RepID=UPI001C648D84
MFKNKNREKKRPIKLKLRVELIVFRYLRVGYFPDTFTMSKFNKEQKIEIYRKWKDEKISISQLSKAYKMNLANLDY